MYSRYFNNNDNLIVVVYFYTVIFDQCIVLVDKYQTNVVVLYMVCKKQI